MSAATETNSNVPSIPLYRLKEVSHPSEIEGRRTFIELTEDEIYPSQHDNEMGESNSHYIIASYLWNALNLFFAARSDVFIAANLNIYPDRDYPQHWFAPDVFAAFGAERRARRSYKLWQEPVFPQVVFEIASERTYKNDITDKVAEYESFGAEEYYIIDSERFLPAPLAVFRRDENNRLMPLHLSEMRVFSPRLQLEIVRTSAQVKLFDPNKQEFLPTLTEAAAKADEAQTEIERLKAELARLKSEK